MGGGDAEVADRAAGIDREHVDEPFWVGCIELPLLELPGVYVTLCVLIGFQSSVMPCGLYCIT